MSHVNTKHTVPECNRCGSFVSGDFVRVFGTEHHTVYACPSCSTKERLVQGDAARDS